MSVAGWIFVGVVGYADIVLFAIALCKHWTAIDQRNEQRSTRPLIDLQRRYEAKNG